MIKRQRNDWLQVRVSTIEKQHLKDCAERVHLSLSDYVRYQLFNNRKEESSDQSKHQS